MSADTEGLEVLIVARPDDEHADVVGEELRRAGARFWRHSLNTWRVTALEWSTGSPLTFQGETNWWTVTSATTVWWRRLGWVSVDDLDEAEAELAASEAEALFKGVLLAQHPRWVDEPLTMARAETKLLQLQTAAMAGARVPPSLVTNIPTRASKFLAAGAVAKAVSSGPGLAPYVRHVGEELAHLVSTSPVLLQRMVDATFDIRVVTVGDQAFAWRSPREPGDTVDWRERDPTGLTFVLDQTNGVDGIANKVASALGLSMSVQDWLQTDEGPVFLEANPQGQWLFLPGASDVVAPALARHLMNA